MRSLYMLPRSYSAPSSIMNSCDEILPIDDILRPMTADDLIDRLKESSRAKYLQRIYKSMMDECGCKLDPVIDGGREVGMNLHKRFHRNNVRSAFKYVNHWILLDSIVAEDLPDALKKEDAMAQLLWDLANFPLPEVLNRLKREHNIVLRIE